MGDGVMNKKDLAEQILNDLLNNELIALEYGQEDYEIGKQDCINVIEDRLKDYIIISGNTLE